MRPFPPFGRFFTKKTKIKGGGEAIKSEYLCFVILNFHFHFPWIINSQDERKTAVMVTQLPNKVKRFD